MKNLVLLVLLLAISIPSIAQSKSNYYIKWEGVSKEGHIVYGVAYTKEEAQFVIDDFNERNAYTQYKIVYQTIKTRTAENTDLIRDFYDLYPRKYRVLEKMDIASLHIFQVGSFDKAVGYLKKNTGKNELETEKYLHQLLKDYQLYRLEERKI